jgi:hypothetical protein
MVAGIDGLSRRRDRIFDMLNEIPLRLREHAERQERDRQGRGGR